MLSPRTKPSTLISSINVTGFLSIMVVLFYIVVFADFGTRCDLCRSESVDLPHVAHPVRLRKADRDDAMTVAIMRDGKVFFRGDQVFLDHLPAKVRQGLKDGAEKKVYIRADARAKYGTVKEALDGIRNAGIENVAFLADQRRAPTP
jgi:biopolymer transport protein TolR